VNGKYKVIAKCQTFNKRYKQKVELYKIIRLTRFQKPRLQSVTIIFQISPSKPSFFSIYCVDYTFFERFEQLIFVCFTQFGGSSYSLNFD